MNDDGTFLFGSDTEKPIGSNYTTSVFWDGRGNTYNNITVFIIEEVTLQEYTEYCKRVFGGDLKERYQHGYYYKARTD